MISLVYALPVGNAIRVYLTPPAGALNWRVLRRGDEAFAGPDDPGALCIYEGDERSALDSINVPNGVPLWYAVFYRMADGAWQQAAPRAGTARMSLRDLVEDVYARVADRIYLGLQAYVADGRLRPPSGAIPVLLQTPIFDEVPFPVVTAHFTQEAAAERFIGEAIAADEFIGGPDEWESFDGYLARTQITVVAHSLNSSERAVLRNALRAILVGNFPVFDAAGIHTPELSISDADNFESYSAPVFQVVCTLSCLAPVVVSGVDDAVRDVVYVANP